MFHHHVGQLGRNHGFAALLEMRETQGKHISSERKIVRNGMETVGHFVNILNLRKVAVVMEFGYQNYSNNIDVPFQMFTSIAVVDTQIISATC